MSEYVVTDTDMISVANAIRTKGSTSASLAFPSGFVSAIEAISSGGTVKLIDQVTVTMVSTASGSSKLTVWLTPATNCAILVIIDEMPKPPAEGYTALAYGNVYLARGSGNNVLHAILRAAGTIGTDGTMCSFTKSTGKLLLGGSYGYFRAGMTYHIYEFEIGAEV